MKRYLLLAPLVVLAACNDVTTANPDTIVGAVRACAGLGGLQSFGIDQHYNGGDRIEAVCKGFVKGDNIHVFANVDYGVEVPAAPIQAASAPASGASQ